MKQTTEWLAYQDQPRQVEGYVVGHFFVHRGQGLHHSDQVSLWIVSHRPTGLRVYGGMRTRAMAVELAGIFNKVKGAGKGKWARGEYLTKNVLEPMKDELEEFKKRHKLEQYQWRTD